jgi:hypothetical protein
MTTKLQHPKPRFNGYPQPPTRDPRLDLADTYARRCRVILAHKYNSFVESVGDAISSDPWRYPTEPQRWWVDHYYDRLPRCPDEVTIDPVSCKFNSDAWQEGT